MGVVRRYRDHTARVRSTYKGTSTKAGEALLYSTECTIGAVGWGSLGAVTEAQRNSSPSSLLNRLAIGDALGFSYCIQASDVQTPTTCDIGYLATRWPASSTFACSGILQTNHLRTRYILFWLCFFLDLFADSHGLLLTALRGFF